MNVLENILEEIEDELKSANEEKENCSKSYYQRIRGYEVAMEKALEIIRKHMNDISDDGWIPAEERLPEEKGDITKDFNLFKESLYLITDGTNVTIAPFDGGYFRCTDDYAPYTDVIAWKPLPEPYKPKKDKTASGEEHIMSRFMKVE